MEKSLIDYESLWYTLRCKLKKTLENMAFLELNKDVYLRNKLKIEDNIPLPIKAEDLIPIVRDRGYAESIPFQKFVDAMICVIGCDEEFKYNSFYIGLLRQIDEKIDSYILNRALELAQNKKYIDALIYFNALDKVSDKHRDIRYNIANALRELAASSKLKDNKDDYSLYYNLSYLEFLKLSEIYREFPYSYYHLGFYYLEQRENDKALDMWQKAYDLIDDESLKDEIQKLMDSVKDNWNFEQGKSDIIEGNADRGLEKLIPLVNKYNEWSECKYFAAMGYRKIGNYKKAETLLNELLSDGENFSEIYNELGLCYYGLGEIYKAVENLRKAISLKSEDVGYLTNLGIVYYELGEIDKAKECIDKARILNPEDEVVKKCEVWFKLGDK